MKKVSIFWFRRDLRLDDNNALHQALQSPYPVLPIFIFDTNIIEELKNNDPRIHFIYENLLAIHQKLRQSNSGVYCLKGQPQNVWRKICDTFDIAEVYANEDYEPYALQRDARIKKYLGEKNIPFSLCKDQVIFAKNEVLKKDNTPYTVYTPYKNRWIAKFKEMNTIPNYSVNHWHKYATLTSDFPSIESLGFKTPTIKVLPYCIDKLQNYAKERDFPAIDNTSKLSPYLRFGTVSIRKIIAETKQHSTFLNELIWREFFMQILYHFPKVVQQNFRAKYNAIPWRNNLQEFERWKNGTTGYPMVDAGIRELNATGYMHNRVRMVVAGFLCKHLLIDWRWGEAYFAEKLLDYELSANNGNWQWAAGTGCDAAPYFRVFNPTEQIKKFDKQMLYIKKWIPEIDSFQYPKPMVEHKMARQRAIDTYKKALHSD